MIMHVVEVHYLIDLNAESLKASLNGSIMLDSRYVVLVVSNLSQSRHLSNNVP